MSICFQHFCLLVFSIWTKICLTLVINYKGSVDRVGYFFLLNIHRLSKSCHKRALSLGTNASVPVGHVFLSLLIKRIPFHSFLSESLSSFMFAFGTLS